jgi:hypothetical protein
MLFVGFKDGLDLKKSVPLTAAARLVMLIVYPAFSLQPERQKMQAHAPQDDRGRKDDPFHGSTV